MKVLYLVPQPRVEGRLTRATFMDEEIRSLAQAGVEPFIVSTELSADRQSGSVWLKSIPARGSLARRMQASRLLLRPVVGLPVPNWSDPRLWFRCGWIEYVAAQVVEEEMIDLIHSHFAWPSGQGGQIVRALTGRPLVAAFRGNDLLTSFEIGYGARKSPVFDRAVRQLLRSADRTVYFSRLMREKGIELGAAPESATVLNKGVDVQHFSVAEDRPALRRRLGFGEKPMILTVAGLIARKGVDHLLQALAPLLGGRDFTFVVVGDGPDRVALSDLAVSLGLGDRTVFTGRLDRQTIPDYFAACDVFVLASLVEAAGNVILEAMASGRPVVCTDSGGPGEFVKDGHTGFVVPVGDTEAIAQKISALLDDPLLAEAFGAAGRQRAVNTYSYDRMTAEILAIYRDVLVDYSRRRVAV